MRREHQLFLEPEHIDCLRAFAAVKRAQCLNSFRSFDQQIAQRDHPRDVLLSMPPAARHDLRNFLIGDERRAVADRGDVVAQVRVSVLLEEIGKLHDMAVGVVHRAVVRCVSHDGTSICSAPLRGKLEEWIKAPTSASAQGTTRSEPGRLLWWNRSTLTYRRLRPPAAPAVK